MTTIKFTADVAGDSLTAIVESANKQAEDFYKDLPGKFYTKDVSISYSEEYFAQRVEASLKEAEERAKAWNEAHPDEEPAEVVPAPVARYDGWVEYTYDVEENQKQSKKTLNEVLTENNVGGEVYSGPPENNPIYQDKF